VGILAPLEFVRDLEVGDLGAVDPGLLQPEHHLCRELLTHDHARPAGHSWGRIQDGSNKGSGCTVQLAYKELMTFYSL